MKYFKIIAILLFSTVISFYACDNKTKAPNQETSEPLEVKDAPTPPKAATPNPASLETAQNAGGVWHYTCLKGCAGGAGLAVNCTTCGNPLVHNQGYHANANNMQNTSPFATPSPAVPNAAVAEPSRNSAGAWHYTCGKGCIGGSGTSGNCSNCGEALAHNTAYHQ